MSVPFVRYLKAKLCVLCGKKLTAKYTKHQQSYTQPRMGLNMDNPLQAKRSSGKLSNGKLV
jgi:hypothetical protein